MDTAHQRGDPVIGPENSPFPTPYCSSTKGMWAILFLSPITLCPPSNTKLKGIKANNTISRDKANTRTKLRDDREVGIIRPGFQKIMIARTVWLSG